MTSRPWLLSGGNTGTWLQKCHITFQYIMYQEYFWATFLHLWKPTDITLCADWGGGSSLNKTSKAMAFKLLRSETGCVTETIDSLYTLLWLFSKSFPYIAGPPLRFDGSLIFWVSGWPYFSLLSLALSRYLLCQNTTNDQDNRLSKIVVWQ